MTFRTIKGIGILLTLTTIFSPALHAEYDHWIVRLRGTYIMPNDSSSDIYANGSRVGNSGVGVDEDFVPELDITYMLTQNIGLELILATSGHTVRARGSLSALNRVISTDVLPPTLTLQYHFNPNGTFRPYAGVGVNYTTFYNEDVEGLLAVAGSDVRIDDSWGLSAQIGMDYVIYKDWFVNADLKYIDLDTTATFKDTLVGKAEVDVDIDPVLFSIGIGRRF